MQLSHEKYETAARRTWTVYILAHLCFQFVQARYRLYAGPYTAFTV
jgi:hypothetical protein